MKAYDLFQFCTASVSSLVAEGVVAGVRVSTITQGNQWGSSLLIVREPSVQGKIHLL